MNLILPILIFYVNCVFRLFILEEILFKFLFRSSLVSCVPTELSVKPEHISIWTRDCEIVAWVPRAILFPHFARRRQLQLLKDVCVLWPKLTSVRIRFLEAGGRDGKNGCWREVRIMSEIHYFFKTRNEFVFHKSKINTTRFIFIQISFFHFLLIIHSTL